MNPEHFRLRFDGKTLIIAVATDDRLHEIGERLRRIDCSEVGPAAWMCGNEVATETLAAAVGELAPSEVIYLASDGRERMEIGFLVAPNTEGGIIVL